MYVALSYFTVKNLLLMNQEDQKRNHSRGDSNGWDSLMIEVVSNQTHNSNSNNSVVESQMV